jgi:phospholipid N-methyltransferase
VNFFIHFVKNLKMTGAVAPSSRFLAKNVVKPLQNMTNPETTSPPVNILELGPGTGALTREIVKQLRPADSLDVVELQKPFFQIIKNKYQAENVEIYLNDFMKFQPEKRYGFIFSSLPYDNMPRSIIRKIWQKKLSLCSPDAYICYFKYVKFRKFKCDYEKQMVDKYKQNKKFVFRNLPPANVYTLQVKEVSAAAAFDV